MEHKYMKIPVLSKKDHESLKNAESEEESKRLLKEIFGDKGTGYWTLWVYKDVVYNVKTGGEGIEQNSTTNYALEHGCSLVESPDKEIQIKEVPVGIDRSLFLEALSVARSGDAAQELIKRGGGELN